MTPADVDEARALLRGPLARSIVFGSFGLALHGARTFDSVPDLDVLARIDDVPAMARALRERGYEVRSWDVALHAQGPHGAVAPLELAGRIYVRAQRRTLTVDITYEGIDVDAWRADALVIDGVTVATVERIHAQRALAGRP